MGKFEKALGRLKNRSKDFTWRELQTIITHLGYTEIKGGGSRRKFIHPISKMIVSLHEPHPRPEIKGYALEIIINHLKEEGVI